VLLIDITTIDADPVVPTHSVTRRRAPASVSPVKCPLLQPLSAMLHDCFGAKPEADEDNHELPLSAESGPLRRHV
jgi:hypothetical protein